MDTSAAVVETDIADLSDVSLAGLAFGYDSEPVLRRVAGKAAVRDERARRAFNSALPARD
jgi:hypothetical protein